jgi:Uncharacterised protein family (UPF0149)
LSLHRHSESPSMAAAAMPLPELERWLQERADRRPVAANVPMLDGYVAAIVAGPVSIDPLDWICPLLAVDADAFNHGGLRSSRRSVPQRGATTTSAASSRPLRIGSSRCTDAQVQW